MKIWTLALTLISLITASVLAGQATDPEVRLRAAMHHELTDGNLEVAIAEYQEIMADPGANRAVAATALLRIGRAYEKLGRPEALDAYERVLRNYGDQRDVVGQAHARLAVARAAPVEQGPGETLHTELVWDEDRCGGVPEGSVSPDGRLMTYVAWCDEGNLAIRDLQSGESWRLTDTADNGNGADGGHFASQSRISPDGAKVAYTWFRSSPAGETGELRVLSLHDEDAKPRTVWSPADASDAVVQDWFPTGDRVVTLVRDGGGSSSIVIVSTLDGRAQQIRSFDWTRDPRARVSRDGRTLAYSRSLSRNVAEKDIFLLSVDGASESVIVQHAADDQVVGWSPGGRHLLFGSNRSGASGLWAQQVEDGKAVGEPRVLVSNLDVGTGLGMTRDGSLHYAVSVNTRRLKVAAIDLVTGTLLGDAVDVSDQFVGNNNVGRFSPNGRKLAYVSQRPPGRVIVLRDLETGNEQVVPGEPPVGQLSWRADGGHLLVQGTDGRGRYGSFEVSVDTGETRSFPNLPRGVFTLDATEVLHRRYWGNANREAIYAYRIADGSIRELPGILANHDAGSAFSVSPDGRWIASNTASEIRLRPISGGDGEVLATTDADEPFGRWTTWTRDGQTLLVPKRAPDARTPWTHTAIKPSRGWDGRIECRYCEGTMWRLWIVPVDGADPVPTELVYEPADAGAIAFDVHPDGKRIVYTTGGGFNQYWAVRNLGLD